jgi:hypothetical protein
VCTECRPLVSLPWRRQNLSHSLSLSLSPGQSCMLHYHRLLTSCIPSRGSNLNAFLFTMKSPATMSMPHDPGHCPRLSLPKFPSATVFLKSCHLRSCEWVSYSEKSFHRAVRSLELMKHCRFPTVYWRAHLYRMEDNRLPRTAMGQQCATRGRTAGRPKAVVVSAARLRTRKSGWNLERREEK